MPAATRRTRTTRQGTGAVRTRHRPADRRCVGAVAGAGPGADGARARRALRSLRHVYLDAGRADEWFLDLGAQAFSAELDKLSVAHTWTCSTAARRYPWRYPLSIAEAGPGAAVSTITADQDLAFAGPAALAEHGAAREATQRELVELYLRRIERSTRAECVPRDARRTGARTAADRRGRRRRRPAGRRADRGEGRHPFGGQEMRPRAPSRRPRPATGGRRATAAPARGGAIPIGITNVPELMIFPGPRARDGITRNPWDTRARRAAHRAARPPRSRPAWWRRAASDGGGSIRIPAACCGLVGMKPSADACRQAARRRLARPPTYGALARTVADSALMLDAMHGSAPGDRYTAPPPARRSCRPHKPRRKGRCGSRSRPSFRWARWRGCPQTSAVPSTRRRACSASSATRSSRATPTTACVSLEFIQT